jgi:hypothetical protein
MKISPDSMDQRHGEGSDDDRRADDPRGQRRRHPQAFRQLPRGSYDRSRSPARGRKMNNPRSTLETLHEAASAFASLGRTIAEIFEPGLEWLLFVE